MEESQLRNIMLRTYVWVQDHKNREEGQGVVEYALVVGAVSVVLIGVLATQGTSWITSVTGKVNTALGIA